MRRLFELGINPNSFGYGMTKNIFVQIYNEGDFKNEKRD